MQYQTPTPWKKWAALTCGLTLTLACALGYAKPPQEITVKKKSGKGTTMNTTDNMGKATFAGGCFWCVEAEFLDVDGVISAVSGYAGGHDPAPTYEKVGSGKTGHTEAVQVTYDPRKVSYATLVEIFWRSIDPTDLGGQFADRGSQYRPAIFYHNAEQKKIAEDSKERLEAADKFDGKIAVPIEVFRNFYPAEDYHQKYCKLNPDRYKRYKNGSGRAGFIEKFWGKTPPARIPVTPENDGVVEVDDPRAACDLTTLSDAELRAKLSPEQYEITRKNGTERPFANAYWDNHRDGIYVDVVSGEPLFSSRDKFESGTGWPSFTKPVKGAKVVEKTDRDHGMVRTEVRSGKANSHLGHVFPDGPGPNGLRYCINSASLRFIPREKLKDEGYGEFEALFTKK